MATQYYQKNLDRNQQPCFHIMGQDTIDLVNTPPLKEQMDTIRIDNKEHILPARIPREIPKVFNKAEYERLQNQAHVITAAERMAMMEEADARKRQNEVECKIRKEELKKAQQRMTAGKKLSKMESEAMMKTKYLLKRAFDLRQEQEDEVKYANRLILASKCLAIRAAQVAEKELIKKEIDVENQRLDTMMEEQRRLSLQRDEEKKFKEIEKNKKFVGEMMQQIREKEIEKLQEGERIEEEARLQNRAIIQMQRDEETNRLARLREQAKIRSNLAIVNEEIAQYKQREKEEDRIAELRVQEFMRKKADREAALEEEQKQQRIAKEKEIARLRAAQEKSADLQAARDEMNALRVQEEVEREWRKKEKAAAEKRRLDEENLKIARRQQIEDIRRQQAVEMQREREDFFKVVQVQKELEEIAKQKAQKRKENNMQHRREILLQVNEKERDRINLRRETFEEGLGIKAEQELREKHINHALKAKMVKLRANQVPEAVVKDIERQLKL